MINRILTSNNLTQLLGWEVDSLSILASENLTIKASDAVMYICSSIFFSFSYCMKISEQCH